MRPPPSFVLRGATVIDGTGRDRFPSDVVVSDGRLGLVEPGQTTSYQDVDVAGLVVAPGFIDTHSHADVESLLADDLVHMSRVIQGVTTEVVGNCGFSPFPVATKAGETVQRFLATIFGPGSHSFKSLDDYAATVEAAGLASNIAPLVGHATLRCAAIGFENREPTDEELDTMSQALSDAMAQGAFGLASGLCYTPATYATSSEIETLARVVSAKGGVYATHIRNETSLTFEALDEAISVSRTTGVDLHISHLKLAGRNQWDQHKRVLGLLEAAREEGVDVTADVYPYTAASTSLHSLLPPWTAEGGIDALLGQLDDAGWRDRVADDLENGVEGWQNLGSEAGWDAVTVASSPNAPVWEGRSVLELGENGERPVDTVARVLATNASKVLVVIDAMSHDDMTAFLAWPHTMIGSDGIPLPGRPHPRLTGTFPRVLGRYRERLGSLEAAVHRMTGASARRFGIPDRGVIADGMVADLVVFDPEGIVDQSTYEEPWLRPSGVQHVLVGGRPAVWDAEPMDSSAGVVLRRNG